MKLSFLPGNLHLTKEQDATYLVIMQGQELLRTRAEKKASAKFNAVRKELESQFPAREAMLRATIPPERILEAI